MKTFHFRVGDVVHCDKFGIGKVFKITPSSVAVEFVQSHNLLHNCNGDLRGYRGYYFDHFGVFRGTRLTVVMRKVERENKNE